MVCRTLCATFLSLLVVLSGCSHNPAGGGLRDGRVFVTVDVPVGMGSGNLLRITVQVEGYDEPFVTELFDYRREGSARRNNVDFEGALNWQDFQGKPIDVTGKMLKAGTEVAVVVSDYGIYHITKEMRFKVDGNAGLRVYSPAPDYQTYELERLY